MKSVARLRKHSNRPLIAIFPPPKKKEFGALVCPFFGGRNRKKVPNSWFYGKSNPRSNHVTFFVLRPRKGVDLAPTVATHHTVPRERNSIWACILAFKDDGVTESRAPSFHGTQLSHTHTDTTLPHLIAPRNQILRRLVRILRPWLPSVGGQQ